MSLSPGISAAFAGLAEAEAAGVGAAAVAGAAIAGVATGANAETDVAGAAGGPRTDQSIETLSPSYLCEQHSAM